MPAYHAVFFHLIHHHAIFLPLKRCLGLKVFGLAASIVPLSFPQNVVWDRLEDEQERMVQLGSHHINYKPGREPAYPD